MYNRPEECHINKEQKLKGADKEKKLNFLAKKKHTFCCRNIDTDVSTQEIEIQKIMRKLYGNKTRTQGKTQSTICGLKTRKENVICTK